jgi:hypothetical protein
MTETTTNVIPIAPMTDDEVLATLALAAIGAALNIALLVLRLYGV